MKKLFLTLALCALLVPACMAIEITDSLGRQVDIPMGAVAAAPGYLAEAWLESGGELCAVTEDAVSERGIQFGGTIMGTAHDVSLEQLVASCPSAVILSAAQASHVKMGEALEQMGIPCAFFDVNTYVEYLDLMEKFCLINGGVLDDNMSADIEDICAASPAKGQSALLLRMYSTGVKAKGSDTVAGAIISDMGLVNVADGGILEDITLEAIIAIDPDWIFAVSMGADDALALQSLENGFLNNPAWAGLSAVKNCRFAVLPRELFHLKPNSRWSESYAYLLNILEGE